MAVGPLSKVTAKSAGEICARFEMSDEARPVLRQGMTPAQCLDALLDKRHYQDAVKFLAHALPKREAVWWACVCVKTVLNAAPPAASAALKASERWVLEPNEDNRRACMPAAEAAQYGTPAGCAALAAFFSGGSLAPPTVAEVPPAETLTGDAVAGAVMMAVVVKEPEKAAQRYAGFLNQGVEVANGKNLWKK